MAHQAAGIVLRDIGDIGAGLRELRAALRAARRSGSADREADVLATLGLTLAYARRTPDALAAFDRSVHLSGGVLAGRVLHRRGMALWRLGRYTAALDDLRRAVDVLRRAHDPIWTSRALTARGMVYLAVGSPGRADADFVAAGRLYAETGQELESVHTVLNSSFGRYALGNLPTALSYLDEAAARYRPPNVPTPFLGIDRCAVLLAAGLVDDALAGADAAIRDIEQFRGQAYWRSELLLMAANCALAAGQPQAAVDRATAAYRLFRSQQSAWWQAQAGLVLARARYRLGHHRPSGFAPQTGRPGGWSKSAPTRRHWPTCWPGGSPSTWAEASTPAGICAPRRAAGSAARPCPAPAAGREALQAQAAADSARCSPPAAAGWTSWTSTGSRWARQNCARRLPRTVPNWPRSRSGTRARRTGRGCC